MIFLRWLIEKFGPKFNLTDGNRIDFGGVRNCSELCFVPGESEGRRPQADLMSC
jgi:hypothetical protein